jgi:LacI family transcriptional regulator
MNLPTSREAVCSRLESRNNVMRRPPTIIDVATCAGVSKSTVSNVLQDKPNVDAHLRERVLEAITQLGYRPNAGARYMRQRSKVLGVVVDDLTNPFHAELATRIEVHAAERMHSILLAITGGVSEGERSRVQNLIEHRVSAMMFLSAPDPESLDLVGPDIPRVFVGITMPGELSIAVDDTAGTLLAVDHLLALGHRKIGFVSAMLGDDPQVELARFQGYQEGIRRAGLRISPTHLLRESGKNDARRGNYRDLLLDLLRRPARPTAIVAALDRIALEIMSVADSLGIGIPEDLSLVGFDDIAISGHSRISLTTVAQPMDELARLAVEAAIGSSSVDGLAPSRKVALPPRLVERRSTAAPQTTRRSK